ncbi:hypothetical protein [Aeromicrobium sp. UC242_57]|uniref:hypothetical protein n=1 Tax=Aeromicrobium sp. UC242_57 TaxID=3374624 RepID=UPI0037A5CFCA
MTPKRLTTRAADRAWALGRRDVGRKYLEVAELVEAEDGEAINVCVGTAVLAGIAAGDVICATALGEYYSGNDHAAAAALLERVDKSLGNKLPFAHSPQARRPLRKRASHITPAHRRATRCPSTGR